LAIEIEKMELNKTSKLTVNLAKGGGFAMHIKKK